MDEDRWETSPDTGRGWRWPLRMGGAVRREKGRRASNGPAHESRVEVKHLESRCWERAAVFRPAPTMIRQQQWT